MERNDKPRLASVKQAGRILGVCSGTVRKLVEDGVLPTVRLRGCIRIPMEELDRICRDRPGTAE